MEGCNVPTYHSMSSHRLAEVQQLVLKTRIHRPSTMKGHTCSQKPWTKDKIMLQTHISEYIRFDKASRFCVKSAFRGFNASKFLVKRVYIYVHVYLQRCPGLLNHLVFFHFQNQLLRELFFSKPIKSGSEIDFSIPSRASLEETWIFKQFQAARKTHDLCLLLFFNHVWRVPWVYQMNNPG